MENRYEYEDEIEINFKDIIYVLKQKLLIIITIGLLFGCLSYIVTKLFITPKYTSTSSMLLLMEQGLESVSDVQMGTQLTKDYSVLITSRPVLDEVIDNLKLDMTYEELQKKITVENPAETRILNITVEDSKPEKAQKIVNEVTTVAAKFIGEKMEVKAPKIIDKGQLPTKKSSPNMKKNALIGLLIGLVFSIGVFAAAVIMDDTIKTEKDVEKYLGMFTLTSVPDRKDYINEKKHRKSRKGRKK